MSPKQPSGSRTLVSPGGRRTGASCRVHAVRGTWLPLLSQMPISCWCQECRSLGNRAANVTMVSPNCHLLRKKTLYPTKPAGPWPHDLRGPEFSITQVPRQESSMTVPLAFQAPLPL